MKIHKYRLIAFDIAAIELPPGAEPISVLAQRSEPVLYVRIHQYHPEAKMQRRAFACFPTGDSDDFPGLKGSRTFMGHLGTVDVRDFVFHVWEVRPL